MELDKFIIGLLVFTAVVLSGVLLIGDVNSNYGEFMEENLSTDEFTAVYDSTDEVYNMSVDMKGSVLGGEVDEDATEDSMFKGVYKALKFVASSFSIVGDIIEAIALSFGIPKFFITLGIAGFAISIVFGLIMIIFRIGRG